MNPNLKQQIVKFASNPAVIELALAMLKVGHEQGRSPEESMKCIIVTLLREYHGPCPTGRN